MTLTDITNQIIGELRKNEVLNESNLKDALNIPKEFEDKADKIIKTSLKELEKTGFIVKIEGTNDWFLKQPLKASGQSVDISMETCNEIADVINAFLDAQGTKGARADKLNITEGEIIMIFNILDNIMVNDPKEDSEDDEDE